jgi:hypothetical protein
VDFLGAESKRDETGQPKHFARKDLLRFGGGSILLDLTIQAGNLGGEGNGGCFDRGENASGGKRVSLNCAICQVSFQPSRGLPPSVFASFTARRTACATASAAMPSVYSLRSRL